MTKETAMKILKELHDKSLFAERTALETIVPELADSEDERVRKDLLAFIKAPYVYDFIVHDRVDPWIAWLEKQGSISVKWQKNTPHNKPAINHSVLMRTTQGIAEGEWQGEDWFQYRWSWTLKESDVLAWMELSDLDEQSEQKPFDYEHATITQKDFASVGETATIELSSPIDCGDRIYHVSHKPIEKNGEQKPFIDFKAKDWYVSKVDGKIHDMTYNPTDKVVIKKGEKPATWSEEDEEMTEDLIKGCISAEKAHHFVHTSKEIADWLKSIKDRIGG